MGENVPLEMRRERLDTFVAWWTENIHGDEKGQAQVFLDRLFQALGHAGVFEAGAILEDRVKSRSRGGTAFADLTWKPRVLIEMKKRGEELSRHYQQAFSYWLDLVPDRPQYVILCNFDEIWIYDLNHQNDEPVDRVQIADLPMRWEALSFLMPVPEPPRFENDLVQLTRDNAAMVSGVFNELVDRGVERTVAQRFILQTVMAMFAEDGGLLPKHSFSEALDDSLAAGSAYDLVFGLFRAMDEEGLTPAGRYRGTPYFNGGLFRKTIPFELTVEEIEKLIEAAKANWTDVRPAIFGTLFERSMEEDERRAQGAHFTSETDIQKVVRPTIVVPWEERIEAATTLAELAQVEADLLQYRVLDPACGCGNFLYIAYRAMRRLERSLQRKMGERRRAEGATAQQQFSFVSTSQFFGMDINAFAVEIAKVTLMLGRKLAANELNDERTVLPLDDLDDNFVAGDALQLPWPAFDCCIGNPPYLGRNWIAPRRGADYAAWLNETYPDVKGKSDYVSYWFRLAHDRLPQGGRAGLVGTTTIRQGDTREASLDYIVDHGGVIYDAVSAQPWTGDAQVRVSIVNWIKGEEPGPKNLWLADGTVKIEVPTISGSLSPEMDLRTAERLESNRVPKRCFQGQTPGRPGFYLTPEEAEELIAKDSSNAEVIFPFLIGDELNSSGRPQRFVIDIPVDDAIAVQSKWPMLYEHLKKTVLSVREEEALEERKDNEETLKQKPGARLNWHHRNFLNKWWQHSYRRRDMIEALDLLPRYIALSRVTVESRTSIYQFVSPQVRPGDRLQVFALPDDYSFGILQSRFHRIWFEGTGPRQGRAVTYATRKVWETFPWPQSPDREAVGGVVGAVRRLLELRDEFSVEGVHLVDAYDTLRQPGASRLYDLHDELDEAVRIAYGFDTDDEPRAQLLALNASILSSERTGSPVRGPGAEGLTGIHSTDFRIDA